MIWDLELLFWQNESLKIRVTNETEQSSWEKNIQDLSCAKGVLIVNIKLSFRLSAATVMAQSKW